MCRFRPQYNEKVKESSYIYIYSCSEYSNTRDRSFEKYGMLDNHVASCYFV